jgi:hypothetical protein
VNALDATTPHQRATQTDLPSLIMDSHLIAVTRPGFMERTVPAAVSSTATLRSATYIAMTGRSSVSWLEVQGGGAGGISLPGSGRLYRWLRIR